MHSLPLFWRLSGVNVILVGTGDAATAKRRILERAGAICVDEDKEARLAVVAEAEDDMAHAAIARLRARGISINAVDRPDDCDFTFPAIVDRDPVLLAIGTGGASAGLAKALRIRLEALLPVRLGRLANALGGARADMRRRWPDARDRRLVLDAALQVGGPLDPLQEQDQADVDNWLQSAGPVASTYILLVISSDDPDDLTLRQARLLGSADVILHHPDISPAILRRARADARTEACSTPPDTPEGGLVLYLGKA